MENSILWLISRPPGIRLEQKAAEGATKIEQLKLIPKFNGILHTFAMMAVRKSFLTGKQESRRRIQSFIKFGN